MACGGLVGREEGCGCVDAAVGEEVNVDSLILFGGAGWVVEKDVVESGLSTISPLVVVCSAGEGEE